MVDEALVKELMDIMDAGASAAKPEDLTKMYEFIKQVSSENEDLAEEIEDMDIAIQTVLTDSDQKFWLKVQEGSLDYGEGEVENPSFTMSSNLEVGAGILLGEVDATSAYMAGDITVEGNLQDAMAFQEIVELSLEAFEDIADEM